MDDLAPPPTLIRRFESLVRELTDLEAIAATRGWEWAVGRLEQAAPFVRCARDDAIKQGQRELEALELQVGDETIPPEWRAGDWMTVHTGRRFWPLEPKPEDVTPEDIAHALALKCRFNGHCRRFYSVGAHSLKVRAMAEVLARQTGQDVREAGAYAVLHDAHEAYLADIPRPVKPFVPGWAELEQVVQDAIHARFGMPPISPEVEELVKLADGHALAIEAAELYGDLTGWADIVYPTDPAVVAAGALEELPLTCEETEQGLLDAIRQTVPRWTLEGSPDLEPEPTESKGSWRGELQGTTDGAERTEKWRRLLDADS